MEPVSLNIQRSYHEYSRPKDDLMHAGNGSSYTGFLKDVTYVIHSFYNGIDLKNASSTGFPIKDLVSTDIYDSAERASGSESNYTLAKLLEESWWNVFDEKYVRHSWEWTLTIIIAYMTILFAGVIGNIMVILMVLQRNQMRTVTNIFIMNLAVADLFVIVFCVGPTLLTNVLQPWILGSFMCKGVSYIQGVSVCAAAYSLVAISLDRCYAVYRPLDRYRGISKSQAFRTISLIWMVALTLTLPWIVVFEIVISDEDGLSYCNEIWSDEFHGKIYFIFVHLILCYGVPLILISVSNAIVWCHVTNRNVPQESASAAIIVKRVHRRARENVRKMLGIVTFTFLLSKLPLYIILTRVKFATDMSDYELHWIEIIMPFAQWLGSWNSCINPILYAFLNRKFREEFHSLLPSWVRFFRVNKIMGMGIGGYGVNVCIRNFSSTNGQTRSISCRNLARNQYRGGYNRSSMLVSNVCNNTVIVYTTRVTPITLIVNFKGKNNLVTLNHTNTTVPTGTLEAITEL